MANEKIKRQLPNVLLDNTPFIIDYEHRLFRQYGVERHQIAFDDLKDEGAYSVLYLPSQGHAAPSEMLPVDSFHLTRVRVLIPNELLQSQSFLESKDLIEYNMRAMENDWRLYVVDEALAKRLSGELPHINVAGTDFTIDWRLRELRETDAPFNILRFSKMELDDTGEYYACFYHTKAHVLYEPLPDIDRMPEDVVLLKIPNELQLDPVAVARQYGLKDYELLSEFPIKRDLKAEVRPLLESGLPELIKRNITSKQTAQKQQRKRNGRHL